MKTNSPNLCSGSALVSLTGVMIVIAVIGMSIIALTQSSLQTGLSAGTGGRAHYLAESGLRLAQFVFCSDGWEENEEQTFTLASGEQIHIVRQGGNFISTGIAHPGTAMEARAQAMGMLPNCLDFGEDGDPAGNPQPSDFVIMGSSLTHVRQATVVEGSVAAIGSAAKIEGMIMGNVVADVITLEHGGGYVIGNLYSAGLTHLSQGFLEGNVHAGGDFLIEGSSTAVNGSIHARGNITIRGGSFVEGDVHSCEGWIRIEGSGKVIGNARAAGDIILTGSGRIEGDADAGGIIQIASTSTPITGTATAGLDIVGPSWFGEAQWNSVIGGGRFPFGEPAAPVCPEDFPFEELSMPLPTDFTAGGARVGQNAWQGIETIPPGSYGNVDLNHGQSRLYLEAGDYYFQSMRFGWAGGIYVDLSSGGDVQIFVEGNVVLGGQFDIHVSTDGTNYVVATHPTVPQELAARIFLETHGNFTMGSPGRWFGTVHTPHGLLTVGNASTLIGGFYSGGGHAITGSTITHVPPNYFRR